MQAVLPGRPQRTYQAVDTVFWEGRRIVAYISRNALIILQGPRDLLRTITLDEDDELSAVAIDKITGKIAIASRRGVHIYRPFGQDYGALQWSLQCDILPQDGDEVATCLSWGLPNELLLGGLTLMLTDTSDEPHDFWTRTLASPVKFASFSHDSALIATTGHHDRLVKIWRRSFGGDNERLDTAYLSHPSTVTSVRWRGRPDEDAHVHSVLYTACADGKLRVWSDADHHCLSILSTWCEIDLVSCIAPRSTEGDTQDYRRFFFFVDSWDFQKLIDQAVNRGEGADREKQLRNNLREVAEKDAEICVVTDDHGHMSAWGIERIGHKARQPNDVLNIAYADGVDFKIPLDELPEENMALLHGFLSQDCSQLRVLTHSFAGRVDWHFSFIDRLFDPAFTGPRVEHEGTLSGHSSAIERIISDESHTRFIALSRGLEAIVWAVSETADQPVVAVQSLVILSAPAEDARFVASADDTPFEKSRLDLSNVIRFVHEDNLSWWDISSRRAKSIRQTPKPTHRLEESGTVHPIISGLKTVEPAIEAASLVQTHEEFAAIVSSDGVSLDIWNGESRSREFRAKFQSHETIHRVQWLKVVDGASVLAIALPHKVIVYSQARLGQSPKTPPWFQVRHIDVTQDSTLPIADIAWLHTGHLLVAAGNQLFVYDRRCDYRDARSGGTKTHDLVQLVAQLNCNLPIYHPTLLEQLLFNASFPVVNNILFALDQQLKFYVEGDDIDHCLNLDPRSLSRSNKALSANGTNGYSSAFDHDTDQPRPFDEATRDSLLSSLSRISLPHLSTTSHQHLTNIVRTVFLLSTQSSALDAPALLYLAHFHLRSQATKTNPTDQSHPPLPFAPATIALHTTTPDALLAHIHPDSLLPWSAASASAIPFWAPLPSLITLFTSIARAEYQASPSRDPTACALFYLALNQKSTLQGLWRLAVGHKERTVTMKFLANDFREERWRSAARKNAYALMGKGRALYAASWFVLGGALEEAVSVLLERVGDLALAVAVARIAGAPHVLDPLLDRVAGTARRERDPWKEAWAQAMRGRRADVLDVLAAAENGAPWRAGAYSTLRSAVQVETQGRVRGAGREAEVRMVRRCVKQWRRMGCASLSVGLAGDFVFADAKVEAPAVEEEEEETESVRQEEEAKEPEKEPEEWTRRNGGPPRKVVTLAPSESSILDSFGF